MKNNWDDKNNDEILLEIKQIEFDYEALKQKLVNDFDNLVDLETKYAEAHKVINERLSGNI
jgi:hypothetical protein